MRFRAKLVEFSCIQHFSRVISTLSRLAKVCTLRITGDKMYFILSERLVNGGVSMWCELAQGHFFNEYAMDGVSEEHNEIYLEVVPETLSKCMKAAQAAKSVKVKLTKKHSPCLTFEVELPSLSSHSRLVTHDVPVTVIPRRLWSEYDEPEMPVFDVCMYLPSLKLVRNIIDRMKNLSNFVVLAANQSGEMKLKMDTDIVTVTTHFRDIEYPTWSDAGGGDGQLQHQNKDWPPNDFAEVRVDIKKLAQFLSGQQVNPTRVICNLVDSTVVHLFLLHEDLSLQYFLPHVSD